MAGVAACLCVVAARPAAAQAPVDSVTLEQALERVLRNSPSMAQSAGAVKVAEWGERTAWGGFLPTLSLTSAASLASTQRFNPQTNTLAEGSADSYNAGVSASLDVFTWGRRTAELRRSRAETASAEAALVEQRFAVILSTKRAFYNVLRADELIRVAAARLARAEQGLAAAERRASVGSATRSDVLRARLELTDARQQTLQAENGKTTAAFALGRLVGADGAVAARATELREPQPLALSEAELEAMVLAQAPLVAAGEAASRAAEAAARVSRAQYFPSLRLSSGYDWFNQEASLSGGRTSWNLRLGFSYPLFNGFQREQVVQRAEVEADVARARLEDSRRAAVAELRRLMAGLRLAAQQLELSGEAVQVAEEDLRVQEERYRLGASTILERLTSQANLLQAELNLVAARYDYQLARAEIEALAGREL
ncbi:MAG: TolC family protein [Gemmatimonadetes bacterium]|nr:TolC family protein [Gemmatimonadota bacterium]